MVSICSVLLFVFCQTNFQTKITKNKYAIIILQKENISKDEETGLGLEILIVIISVITIVMIFCVIVAYFCGKKRAEKR